MRESTVKRDRLIVALDVEDFRAVRRIVKELSSSVSFYKVGLSLFTREGPLVVQWLKKRGLRVFLDLKFHDIPNTVFQAVQSAVALGVDILTLHASGGLEMMEAAVQAANQSARRLKKRRPKIFAVTVLTSHSNLGPLGISASIPSHALRLVNLAKRAGVDGVVCSPLEIRSIKRRGKGLLVLTPGIRLPGGGQHDQKRVSTPAQALKDGADYLVIGRPVYQSSRPREVVKEILRQTAGL